MKNITLAVDEAVLDRVRVIAAERKTTVNAMVRDYLTETAAQVGRREAARRALLDLIDNSTADMGPNYKWNREALYEDRMLPRHKSADLRDDGEAA
jgi:hypothetical protein